MKSKLINRFLRTFFPPFIHSRIFFFPRQSPTQFPNWVIMVKLPFRFYMPGSDCHCAGLHSYLHRPRLPSRICHCKQLETVSHRSKASHPWDSLSLKMQFRKGTMTGKAKDAFVHRILECFGVEKRIFFVASVEKKTPENWYVDERTEDGRVIASN